MGEPSIWRRAEFRDFGTAGGEASIGGRVEVRPQIA